MQSIRRQDESVSGIAPIDMIQESYENRYENMSGEDEASENIKAANSEYIQKLCMNAEVYRSPY